jgi:hypothetical protein
MKNILQTLIAKTGAVLSWIETRSTLVQTILAGIMLWTLVQMSETNRISRQQLQLTVEPVVEFAQFGNDLLVSNVGVVPITQLGVLAVASIRYDLSTEQVNESYAWKYPTPKILIHALAPGQLTNAIPMTNIMDRPNYGCSASEMDARLALLEYRRASDMKQFYKAIYFTRMVPTDGHASEMFMPLLITQGMIQAPGPMGKAKQIKACEELRATVRDVLDITLPVN